MATGLSYRTFSTPSHHLSPGGIHNNYDAQASRNGTHDEADHDGYINTDSSEHKEETNCNPFQKWQSPFQNILNHRRQKLNINNIEQDSNSKTLSSTSPKTSNLSKIPRPEKVLPATGQKLHSKRTTLPPGILQSSDRTKLPKIFTNSHQVPKPDRKKEVKKETRFSVLEDDTSPVRSSLPTNQGRLVTPSGQFVRKYPGQLVFDKTNFHADHRRHTMSSAFSGKADSVRRDSPYRSRTRSVPAVLHSIMKQSSNKPDKSRNRMTPQRRTLFSDSVDVYYFDHSDQPKISPPQSSQRNHISTHPNRHQWIRAPKHPHADKVNGNTSLPTSHGLHKRSRVLSADDINSTSNLETRTKTHVSFSAENLSYDSLKMSRTHKDSNKWTTSAALIPCQGKNGKPTQRLKLSIRFEGSFIHNCTSVKALSGGRAVIVKLQENEQETDSKLMRKFPLPVRVDPYQVTAHVHKDGLITVEAPVSERLDP